MNIKTILCYYLSLVSVAVINKSTKKKQTECVEKRETSYTFVGNVTWYNCDGEQDGVSFKN